MKHERMKTYKVNLIMHVDDYFLMKGKNSRELVLQRKVENGGMGSLKENYEIRVRYQK